MMKESIDSYQAEDPNWIFSDHANELYAEYFKQRKALYEGNAKEIQKIQEEEAERERLLLEHSNQVQKEALEQSQAARVTSEKQKEELAAAEAERQAQQQVRAEANAQFQEELRNGEIEGLQEVTAVQVDTSIIQQGLALQNATLTQTVADTEAKSLKTRIQQWKEYAEKVSAISQKVSEATGLATSSLSGMFSQISASYTQELESINGKITALDEEKEAALERATLTQDERRAREEELEQQTMNSMYAITHEQKNKADERIAILQGELNAEDTISREFESKKADLEKEKEKKEKAQKKAEKQQKRLDMGQAIVEATGNIAQGITKALSHGPILGSILAAIVAGAGAVQVGIMTKQLSKMEDGGLLSGKRHSQGGMPILGSNIEVEGGEYVVNRQSTGKNLGLLSYINEQRRQLNSNDIHNFFSSPQPRIQAPQYAHLLEKGGQVPMLPMSINMDTQQILAAISNIDFQPHVSVTDINHVQKQMALVDEWVGMK